MKCPTSVIMTPVLLLLCSGLFQSTFASNRLRIFSANETEKNDHENSLKICNQKNESLVTLYDEDDAKFVFSLMEKDAWLGLQQRENSQPTWSNGDNITFRELSENITNMEQICVAIDNTTWKGFNCSERKPFMCYNEENEEYILVEQKRNWCQALQHCTRYHNGLVSINDTLENDEVINVGNESCFWIGLLYDKWEWVDKSCSTFRKWQDSGEDYTHHCAKISDLQLYAFGCKNDENFLCSKGNVRIKVIKKEKTWEEAFYYCKTFHTGLLWIEDDEDQKAVNQWLNYTNAEEDRFWIGLRQSRIFGFWIWTSDRMVTHNNWKNDTVPELPLSNHCGVITKKKWSDENCLVPLPFLCEEEIFIMDS